MKSALTAAAVLAALAGSPALAQSVGSEPAAAAQPADAKQVLESWSRDVMAAKQIGYLAADKNVDASVALLADQVALLNSEIANALTRIGNRSGEQELTMSEDDQRRLDAMSEINQDAFASQFLGFLRDTYPRLVAGAERLSGQAESEEIRRLASQALPRLQDQLRAATQLAQAGSADPQAAERTDRGPIQRKDDPAVIPERPNAPDQQSDR